MYLRLYEDADDVDGIKILLNLSILGNLFGKV